MRGMSSLVAAAAIAMAWAEAGANGYVMPAALPAGTTKTNRGRKCVAQAKREAIKLRRQKSHRMHCRGRRS